MLNQLLGSPILLFLALLPLCLIVAVGLRLTDLDARVATSLGGVALIVFAVAVLAHLGFAFTYLASANYTDHIEPNTAVVAWLWANGGQVFHPVDSAERYAFLYGPLAYMATGLIYMLFGASTFTSKLAGIICLLIALTATAASVRKRLPAVWYPVLVALGYFSLLALFFKNFSFWSKPDSFMIAASAVGLWSCTLGTKLRPRILLAWLICGVALGVAAGAKITGVLYFLPYVAWFFERDGIKAPFVIGFTALLITALPFLAPESVSLTNYVAWLQAAGGHGLSKSIFVQNAFFAGFALLPLLMWLIKKPALLWQHKWIALASMLAYGLVLIAASKPGSGPHHFMPFLPALGFVAALAVASGHHKGASAAVFWAPLGAFLAAAAIKTGFALFYGLRVLGSHDLDAGLVQEMDQVIEQHPNSNIYMGYGDGSRYVTTFVRNHLAYRGYPYLVDASAVMDFQLSGINIPQATVDALLADASAVWLVPVGQEPFTLVSWYYRDTGGRVFDENFRAAFVKNFAVSSATEHYDVYTRRGPQE